MDLQGLISDIFALGGCDGLAWTNFGFLALPSLCLYSHKLLSVCLYEVCQTDFGKSVNGQLS